MSNVKYQQALHQAQALLQRYVREREEYTRKDAFEAAQQV